MDNEKDKELAVDGSVTPEETGKKEGSAADAAGKEAPAEDGVSEKKNGKKKRRPRFTLVLLIVCLVLCVAVLAALALSIFAPDLFDSLFHKDPVSANRTVMTVNGREISAEEYLSYVLPYKVYLESANPNIWAESPDMSEKIKSEAANTIINSYDLLRWAAELGITEETVEPEFAEAKQGVIDQYESRQAFEDELVRSCLTEEMFDYKLRQELIIVKLQETVYSEGSSYTDISLEEMRSYYTENDLYAAKHILLLSGADEEQDAQKLELAEDILARLRAGEDFDTLMREYSEDTGVQSFPDGYIAASGSMVPEFEDGARALKVGEISDIVTSDYGYHIIMRVEPDDEMIRSQVGGVMIDERVSQKLEELEATEEVVYDANYSYIDVAKLENAFAERQAELAAADASDSADE